MRAMPLSDYQARVHEYDPIDDGKVLAAVGTMLDLYPRYIAAIEAELTKLTS